MTVPESDELEEQHYQAARRRWSSKPTPELVYEFAVVRGDLSTPYAREQLAALIDLKVADAERVAVVKALRDIAELRRGPHLGVEHVPAQWISERADAIENGADQ